jgi:hypothetical protein
VTEAFEIEKSIPVLVMMVSLAEQDCTRRIKEATVPCLGVRLPAEAHSKLFHSSTFTVTGLRYSKFVINETKK